MENNLHSFDAINLESDLHEFLNETNSKVVEVSNLWSLLVMWSKSSGRGFTARFFLVDCSISIEKTNGC